jgi:hypothetical protein
MGTAQKPDTELLLPIGRPRCPKCHMRMVTADVSSGPEGFEHRTFGCLKCGHTESKVIACDPLKSDAVGWLSGELGHNAAPTKSTTDECVPGLLSKGIRCGSAAVSTHRA